MFNPINAVTSYWSRVSDYIYDGCHWGESRWNPVFWLEALMWCLTKENRDLYR